MKSAEPPGSLSDDLLSVTGTCPACGAEELCRYPVLASGGWFMVVKCQVCLTSLSREPWRRLGWISLAEDSW
jgi:vanillate/4-hydroxybenzoate decarboxylase subunit D